MLLQLWCIRRDHREDWAVALAVVLLQLWASCERGDDYEDEDQRENY